MYKPVRLFTVIRDGGMYAGLRGVFGGALASAASARAVAAADPVRGFGTPSSVTHAAIDSHSPTLTVRFFSPSILITGRLFARTSGLLVPAPSAPVSDAITTSSMK